MKNFSLGLSLLLSTGFLMIGCGSSDGGSACEGGQVDCGGNCIDPIEPTLEAIQSRIFDVRGCSSASCHDSEFPAAELDLSSASVSGASLVDVNAFQSPEDIRVTAGDSSASYLMNKILGIDMALGTVRMPPNDMGTVLCDEEINAIRQWIDDGANPAPSN